MAFKASGIIASDAFDNIRRQAAASKKYAEQQKAAFQAATVSADTVIAVIQHAATVLPRLEIWSTAPGLLQYAQQQEGDPTYDVQAEYVVMRNAIRDLRDTLIALFPKDGSGFLLYQRLNADGTIDYRTFTAAQLAATLPLFDAVIESVFTS